MPSGLNEQAMRGPLHAAGVNDTAESDNTSSESVKLEQGTTPGAVVVFNDVVLEGAVVAEKVVIVAVVVVLTVEVLTMLVVVVNSGHTVELSVTAFEMNHGVMVVKMTAE